MVKVNKREIRGVNIKNKNKGKIKWVSHLILYNRLNRKRWLTLFLYKSYRIFRSEYIRLYKPVCS